MSILDQVASGGLTTIIGEALGIVNKFVKDPEQQVQAQIEMMKITQSDKFKEIDAILTEQKGQTDVNLVEAQSESIFKSGWRPFVGWVCGSGFAMHVILFPLIASISQFFGFHFVPPELQVELLMSTLMGMLGIGGMRTYEKTKGVR